MMIGRKLHEKCPYWMSDKNTDDTGDRQNDRHRRGGSSFLFNSHLTPLSKWAGNAPRDYTNRPF
jgi:hypothetical protein